MSHTTIHQIDQNGLKTGQAITIMLLVSGFVLNSWQIVAVVALCQLLGALAVPIAPYRRIYQHLVKPLGLVKPRITPDHPEPHRFAMLVGALFNTVASVALLVGWGLIGWSLVWIVIALANLNFWLNFCLGCWMYYRLHRWGVPGFTASPLGDR